LEGQIAQSDIYTLNADGQIEMQTPEGMIILPGILVSKDGKMTVTNGNETLEADLTTIKIDGQTLSFQSTDGKIWVWNGKKLMHTFSNEEIDRMTDEEKLAVAPKTISGFTKSNVSTIKNELVIYRDAEGKAVLVYNLSTGETFTLTEGGIIEFILTDGERLEMAYFEDSQEAIDFIASEAKWHTGDRTRVQTSWLSLSNRNAVETIKKLRKIPGYTPRYGFTLPEDTPNFFVISVVDLENDTLILSEKPDGTFHAVIVEGSEIYGKIFNRELVITVPDN
jgi:hypothetical protein